MSRALSLLLVDGHAGVRSALTARLRQEPMVARVATAATLDAALRAVQEHPPDVVLYDPRTVPGEAVAAVRQLAQDGRCVVVLTSSLRPGEVGALPQAGAAALLFKGTAIATLLACLDEVRFGRTAAPPAPPPDLDAS